MLSSQIEHQRRRSLRAFTIAFLVALLGFGIILAFQGRIPVLEGAGEVIMLGALVVCFAYFIRGFVLTIRLFMSKAG